MKTTIIHAIRRGIPGKSSLRSWPLAAVLAALMLAVAFSPSVAGSPHSAFYSSANDQIFWFIHASDLHVGTSGSTDSNNLYVARHDGKEHDQPLLHRRHGRSHRLDQRQHLRLSQRALPGRVGSVQEHRRRKSDGKQLLRHPGKPRRLQRRRISPTTLANSVQGRATGSKQHSWTRTFPFGTYHFLGVNTADNSGDPFSIFWPYGDYAGLDTSELDFIYTQLAGKPRPPG